MTINFKFKMLIICAILTNTPTALYAKIYSCNVNGVASFSDQPCETTEPEIGDPLKPYWYINMPANIVADTFNVKITEQGVLNFENEKYIVNFESNEDQIITFIQVRFKGAQCKQGDNVNIRGLIDLFDLRIGSLIRIPNTAHYAHSFNDHDHKLKVSFMCQYDGDLYTAGFSQRNYTPH